MKINNKNKLNESTLDKQGIIVLALLLYLVDSLDSEMMQ